MSVWSISASAWSISASAWSISVLLVTICVSVVNICVSVVNICCSTLSTVELLKEDFAVDWSLLAYEQVHTVRCTSCTIFVWKSDCLGCPVLLCLVVCLTLLTSFFLPSHLSLTHSPSRPPLPPLLTVSVQ